MSLSKRGLLAYVTINSWTGQRQDARAQRSVATEFKTTSDVGRYKKSLLPGAAELNSVHNAAGRLRKFFHYRTLPWLSDGTRIVSSIGYIEFTREFKKLQAEFDTAVSEFCTAYPSLKAQAEQKLGDLFDVSEYPDVATLKSCFQCTLSVMPLPDVADFRTEVSDAERADFLKSISAVETQATQDCFRRLHTVITKAIDTLSKPDAKFKDTLIDNIRECCELLPKLNVTDSAELDQAVQSTNQALANVSADACREDSKARQSTADALKAIESLMANAMGRAQ